MTKKKSTAELPEHFSNVFKSMQSAMSANPLVAPQAEHFWHTQEQLLEAAETFTRSWFDRRHEATRTAMIAARRAAEKEASNPNEALQTVAEWQRHSMERMVEDAREWLDMITRCASIAAVSEVEAAEDVLKETQKATKTAKSEPV